MIVELNNKSFDYNKLIIIARSIDPVNYMDIVHDHILDGKPMKGIKYDYLTVKEYDTTVSEGTQKVCCLCNEILPIACFNLFISKGKTYTGNQCKKCLIKKKNKSDNYIEYQKQYFQKKTKIIRAEKIKTDPEYKNTTQAYHKKYFQEKLKIVRSEKIKSDPEYKNKIQTYAKNYRDDLENAIKIKKYKKEYYQKNKDLIKANSRRNYYKSKQQ